MIFNLASLLALTAAAPATTTVTGSMFHDAQCGGSADSTAYWHFQTGSSLWSDCATLDQTGVTLYRPQGSAYDLNLWSCDKSNPMPQPNMVNFNTCVPFNAEQGTYVIFSSAGSSVEATAPKAKAIECIVNQGGQKGFCQAGADSCCDHYDSSGRMAFQECYNSASQVCCKGVVCPSGTCDASGAVGRCTASPSFAKTVMTPKFHRAPAPKLRSGTSRNTIVLSSSQQRAQASHLYQTQYSGPDCTGAVVRKLDVNPENQCTRFAEGGSGQYYCNYDTLTEADWTKCDDCKSCPNDVTTTRPNGYCFNVEGEDHKSVSNACSVTPAVAQQ